MSRRARIAAVALAGTAWPAQACTLCHSRVAEDVRAAVLGSDFWSNLSALLLPFPLLAAAVLLVRRMSPAGEPPCP